MSHLFALKATLRQRLFWFMQIVFVYKPTREYYLSQQHCDCQRSLRCLKQSCSSSYAGTKRSETDPNRCTSDKCRSDDDDFCLPEEPRWAKVYAKLWSSIQVYSIIQSSSLIFIFNSFLGANRHLNCYVLGRLALHESFVDTLPYLQWISNVLMLTWRAIILHAFKHYRLDCIVFLTTDRRVLESRSLEFDLQLEMQVDQCSMAPWLRRVLYMEMSQSDGRILLFLRPNRTLKTHQELTNFFNRFFAVLMAATASLLLFMVPLIVRTCLFDLCFIRNYPGCMPELDERARAGQLSAWSVALLGWPNYRWLTLPFDAAINLAVWFGDLAGLMIPSTLAILLSQDLVIYWRDLSTKLSELHVKMSSSSSNQEDHASKHQFDDRAASSNRLRSQVRRKNLAWPDVEFRGPLFGDDDSKLDLEIHILQQQVIDFFRQLWHYNRYVSLITTFFFMAWFTLFMVSSYFAATLDNKTLSTIIRVIQIYGFVAILAPLYVLLRIRTQLKRAYPLMASIMCLERVPMRKEYWSQILEYYTYKPAFGFTLLGGYPITWMSYLNLIASSVSFLVVLDTFWMFKDRASRLK